MSLEGKRAIVTGSNGALGSVVTLRFLKEGAIVVGSSRDSKAGSPEPGPSHFSKVQADVTLESDVQSMFQTAVRTMGGIDIVVNTVGGFLPRKPVAEVTVEEWDRMMNINLKSSFLCTREAIRRMKGQRYGRIVNISAMVGLNPSAGRAAYAIAKSGVTLLTQIAAEEQKGSGIKVNAIAPGILDTVANRNSMPDQDFSQWVKAENIADLICYLCSDAAGEVAGTTIRAFGGT